MIKVKRTIRVSGDRKGEAAESPIPEGHIPRVSKLMALAIKFDRLIQDGTIADQSELARLAHV